MGKQIDLKNYQVRTDLAIEAVEGKTFDGIQTTNRQVDDLTITEVTIRDGSGSTIGKKDGMYVTIEFDDVTDYDNKEKIKRVFTDELNRLLLALEIKEDDTCMVIGLGNELSTPDALGPKAIDKIIVTKHLADMDGMTLDEGFKEVSILKPGVTGSTGIETSLLIQSVVKTVQPDFLIVVDALASQSINRVNKTIQMTDSGIHPGSGVGNSRKEISKETIGIPVIAVGIPTVVDAVTIVSDTIDCLEKHYAYMRDNINDPVMKLTPLSSINYLKQTNVKELGNNEKQQLMGVLGSFTSVERRQLISEVLSPVGYNLMVTPKEIDFVLDKLCDIVGNGINMSLHKKVSHL